MSTPTIPPGYRQKKVGEKVRGSDKFWDDLLDPPAWTLITKGWANHPVIKGEIIICKIQQGKEQEGGT